LTVEDESQQSAGNHQCDHETESEALPQDSLPSTIHFLKPIPGSAQGKIESQIERVIFFKKNNKNKICSEKLMIFGQVIYD